MKTCNECRMQKTYSDFFSDVTRKDGLSYICKLCKLKRTSLYQKKHPEKTKVYSKRSRIKNALSNKERRLRYYSKYKDTRILNAELKTRYGITLDYFNFLLEGQKNVCAICKETCRRKKRLSVDHNHTTKEVRGLLCDDCNNGIGRFKDSVFLLKRAIKYLNK